MEEDSPAGAHGTVEGWQRLTIMMRASNHVHHHLLATDLLNRARRAHLAGATLLEALQPADPAHGARHLFRDDTRLSLVVVDRKDRLAAFLAEHEALLHDAVVVLDDVRAFRA